MLNYGQGYKGLLCLGMTNTLFVYDLLPYTKKIVRKVANVYSSSLYGVRCYENGGLGFVVT